MPIHPPSGTVMLIRRGMNQGNPNTWAFFGGKMDDEDLNPKETAKREFLEESGVENIKFYLTSKPVYINDDNHHRFYNFIGIFTSQFVPDLEKEDEAQDYGWFPLDSLPHNMHPGTKEFFNEKMDLVKSLIDFYS